MLKEDTQEQENSVIEDRYRSGRGAYAPKSGAGKKNDSSKDDPNGEARKLGWENKVQAVGGGDPRAVAAKKAAGLIMGNKGKLITGGFFSFGLMVVFFFILSPTTLLGAFAENLSITGDSSAITMERRFTGVLQKLMSGSFDKDGVACKTARCVGGSLSNKGLKTLHKKGIEIEFKDGSYYDGKTKKGMPGKKIAHFKIGDDTVTPKGLKKYLANNPKAASKILGPRGAFHLRYRSMSGKYIKTLFFNKFGLSKGAVLAQAFSKPFKNAKAKFKGIAAAVKNRIPALSKVGDAVKNIKPRLETKMEGAKKGGIAYMIALTICLISKIPAIVAGAAASAEAARIIVPISDISSMSSFAKGAPMLSQDDENIKLTPEMYTNASDYLSETDENGDSPFKSPYLSANVGYNSAPLALSKEFAPGYDALNNSIVAGGMWFGELLSGPCSLLMSPLGMALGTTLSAAGGPVSFAVTQTLAIAFKPLSSQLFEWAGKAGIEFAVSKVLTVDKLDGLRGLKRGHMLGIGAMVFFAAHGLARHGSVLSRAGVKQFAAIKDESLEAERQRDIASHNPLDISNRNTFMGSIVNNARLAMIKNGGLSNNMLARLSAFARMPISFASMALTGNTAEATSLTNIKNGGFADVIGLVGESDEDTPCVTAALTPCIGENKEQSSISASKAEDIVESMGWIDLDSEVPEDVSAENLIKAVLKKDTPMSLRTESCVDLINTGDYLFEMGGCMGFTSNSKISLGSVDSDASAVAASIVEDEAGKLRSDLASGINGEFLESEIMTGGGNEKYTDIQALNAVQPYMEYIQIASMINGNDEEEGGGSSSVAGVDIDMDNIYEDSTNIACGEGTTEVRNDEGYNQGTMVPIKICSIDIAEEGTEVNSRSSAATAALMKQMKEDLNIEGPVLINSSFRTMAGQQAAYAQYGADQAARPGYSNHQMGLALDFNMGDRYGWSDCGYRVDTTQCPNSKVWVWLKENAYKYGFKQYSREYWHWSPVEDTEYK